MNGKNIKYLQYFICLAEELHFGRAAEKLHIVQPALSIQIQKFENLLGGELFERNKRKVTLTETGKTILIKAKEVVKSMEDFYLFSNMAFNGCVGEIRISYSGLPAYSNIMGANISKFRDKYPNVNLILDEIEPWEQLQNLIEGGYHLPL